MHRTIVQYFMWLNGLMLHMEYWNNVSTLNTGRGSWQLIRRNSFIQAFSGFSDLLQFPWCFVPNGFSFHQRTFKFFGLFLNQEVSTLVGHRSSSVVWIMCVRECEKVFWKEVFSNTSLSISSPKSQWVFSKRWPLVATCFLLHCSHRCFTLLMNWSMCT